jgi:hypothetical protein
LKKRQEKKKRNKKSSRNKITERKLGEKETRKLTIYIYIYIKQSPFSNPKSTTEIATNFHPPS